MTRVLFLGKADDWHSTRASMFCERNFTPTETCLGRHGDPFPEVAANWTGDVIISYLSRWIVPGPVLARADCAAINFHPAPPEYPGIGCINFALYDAAGVYGVTCHHMGGVVDSGAIIDVRRFPILDTDNVASLLNRTYDYQLAMFCDVMSLLLAGDPLPRSSEHWGRHRYTRRELNELAMIRPDMSPDEVRRRVRATTYGDWRPEIRVHGLRFAYQREQGGEK